MMEGIGGYFELELQRGRHYHEEALRLNTARNSFEYVLRARRYSKVYIPYYTCGVMLEPLKRLGIDYDFYTINENLEPEREIWLEQGEAFLYTNYFGLKQRCVERLAEVYGKRLIVDNAQAFYAPRVGGIDAFYSPRKYFGVPDGGYLYTDCRLDGELSRDKSWDRMEHLVRRLDEGAEAGYASFQESETSLDNSPVKLMSRLTERILAGVDYEWSRQRRRENFLYLHGHLGEHNKLKLELQEGEVPMVYPLWVDAGEKLRQELIRNKIFVATYWSNVLEWCPEGMLESDLARSVLALPVDQRYMNEEIKKIIHLISVIL